MTLTVESIIGAMQEYVYEQLNDSPEPNEKKLATSKQQNPLDCLIDSANTRISSNSRRVTAIQIVTKDAGTI